MTIKRVYVALPEDVWGNQNMLLAAQETAKKYSADSPLIVNVREHAGWFLEYIFRAPGLDDGVTVGTANCGADFGSAVRKFFDTHCPIEGATVQDREVLNGVHFPTDAEWTARYEAEYKAESERMAELFRRRDAA